MKESDLRHQALHFELAMLMKKYSDEQNLSAQDILAVVGVMAGQAIAMQDQRKMDPDAAIKVLMANIEIGNKMVIDMLQNGTLGQRRN